MRPRYLSLADMVLPFLEIYRLSILQQKRGDNIEALRITGWFVTSGTIEFLVDIFGSLRCQIQPSSLNSAESTIWFLFRGLPCERGSWMLVGENIVRVIGLGGRLTGGKLFSPVVRLRSVLVSVDVASHFFSWCKRVGPSCQARVQLADFDDLIQKWRIEGQGPDGVL